MKTSPVLLGFSLIAVVMLAACGVAGAEPEVPPAAPAAAAGEAMAKAEEIPAGQTNEAAMAEDSTLTKTVETAMAEDNTTAKGPEAAVAEIDDLVPFWPWTSCPIPPRTACPTLPWAWPGRSP